MNTNEPRDLMRQTLRTVAVLVGACILFVGVLSAAAVTITNRAIGAKAADDTTELSRPSTSSHGRPQSI